jgi:hypothetical protein
MKASLQPTKNGNHILLDAAFHLAARDQNNSGLVKDKFLDILMIMIIITIKYLTSLMHGKQFGTYRNLGKHPCVTY